MPRLFKDRRGSAEIIAFILILPLILMPLWEGFSVFKDIYRYDIMKQAARQALLRMETQGGLTPADYSNLVLFLTEKGFDADELTINYSTFPVNYGNDVAIELRYNYTKTRFDLTLTGLERTDDAGVMVYGPLKSTSKHYER